MGWVDHSRDIGRATPRRHEHCQPPHRGRSDEPQVVGTRVGQPGGRQAPPGIRPQPHRGGARQAALGALPARIHAFLRADPLGGGLPRVLRRDEESRRGHGAARRRHPGRDRNQRRLFLLAGVPRRNRHCRAEAPVAAAGPGPARRAAAGDGRRMPRAGRRRRPGGGRQRAGGLPADRGVRREGQPVDPHGRAARQGEDGGGHRQRPGARGEEPAPGGHLARFRTVPGGGLRDGHAHGVRQDRPPHADGRGGRLAAAARDRPRLAAGRGVRLGPRPLLLRPRHGSSACRSGTTSCSPSGSSWPTSRRGSCRR